MMQPEDASAMVNNPEAITRAKHKGRAYQCMPCYHKEGKETIDVKGRMEEHILKNHVSLDEVPYYCRLCLFRCQRHDQLIQHVTGYARHREMAAKRRVTEHAQFLVTSPNPHQFTEMDYIKLSAEASLSYFLQHQAVPVTSPVTAAVQRMESGELMDDISTSTMEAGFISCTAPATVPPQPTAGQTYVEQAGQQIQLCELQTSMVQSLLSLLAGTSTQLTAPVTATNQVDEACHDVAGAAETASTNLFAGPVYVPTPKTLLRKLEGNKRNAEESPVQQVHEQPNLEKKKVPETSQQSQDTSAKAIEEDKPLDLSGGPAATETLHLPSHQEDQVLKQPSPESEASRQPQDTSETSDGKDQPLDLSLKPASLETLNPPNQQDHLSGEVSRETSNVTDTRLVVMTSDPVVDNPHMNVSSPSVCSPEGSDSTQGDQMTLDDAEESEEEEPVPSRACQPEDPKATTDETVMNKGQEENILSQILAPEPMELSSSYKRPSPDVDAPVVKRRKGDAEEPSVNISLVAINSLVTVLQDLRENERQRIKSEEKITKALTENTTAMQKLTGVVLRLEETIKNNEKGERRREERRQELEQARQDERRRQKEEEKKLEEKRWEMDRIARGERRRAEEKQKGKPSLPSVLANKENHSRKSKKD